MHFNIALSYTVSKALIKYSIKSLNKKLSIFHAPSCFVYLHPPAQSVYMWISAYVSVWLFIKLRVNICVCLCVCVSE